MSYFLAVNQAYDPLEVPVIDDPPIITGLLSIFPIEILRREEDSRNTWPHHGHNFPVARQCQPLSGGNLRKAPPFPTPPLYSVPFPIVCSVYVHISFMSRRKIPTVKLTGNSTRLLQGPSNSVTHHLQLLLAAVRAGGLDCLTPQLSIFLSVPTCS